MALTKYTLIHMWNFADGRSGSYQIELYDYDEAFARFEYLKLLMENDDYDFNAKFSSDYHDGDSFYSVYEDKQSLCNRTDLILRKENVL